MKSGLILKVSFSEKDDAKALGARWNPMLKKWYVPEDMDISLFSRWLPDQYDEDATFAYTPIYLVKSADTCWKCGNRADVFCLASDGFESEGYFYEGLFVTYGYLESIPKNLLQYFRENCPSYYPDYSKTTNNSYCMNHCSCGAKLGDFYLHSEPGGGFFPTNEKRAKEIVLAEIRGLNSHRIELSASPGQQYPNPICQFSRRC